MDNIGKGDVIQNEHGGFSVIVECVTETAIGYRVVNRAGCILGKFTVNLPFWNIATRGCLRPAFWCNDTDRHPAFGLRYSDAVRALNKENHDGEAI